MLKHITQFIYKYKNKTLESKDISFLSNEFEAYSKELKVTDYYKIFYDNYLNIKGYTYRLEDVSQRLFYTFQEAVYAIDLAKLTKDEDSITLNSVVYCLVINDCIDEYLKKDIDENIKSEAISFYKKEQIRASKENQKYHMYQN